MKSLEDTIAAISTFPAESAIGVIRISGHSSFPIINKIFIPRSKKTRPGHAQAVYGSIKSASGILDNVIVTFFKNPSSYTGEDLAEISTHGSPFVLYKIMTLLIEKGCRLAEPGEFTRRAFLNGKIDLSQAEAVADLISTKNDNALTLAINQLNGREKHAVNKLRSVLLDIMKMIETEIDFAYEDTEKYPPKTIASAVDKALKLTVRILKGAQPGIWMKNGIRVVIAGRPNAGKSSLLNSLLKKKRAIVTHIPGTTRDIIEESVKIGGYPYLLSDTAGIRTTAHAAEKQGIRMTKKAVKNADLVVFVIDGSKKTGAPDSEIYKLIKNKRFILALNKSDLKLKTSLNDVCSAFPGSEAAVLISCVKKPGINSLTKELKNIIINKGSLPAEKIVISNLRHKECMENTAKYLQEALNSLNSGRSPEFAAVDVKRAIDQAALITGEISSEDVLSSIFSGFCIGK